MPNQKYKFSFWKTFLIYRKSNHPIKQQLKSYKRKTFKLLIKYFIFILIDTETFLALHRLY